MLAVQGLLRQILQWRSKKHRLGYKREWWSVHIEVPCRYVHCLNIQCLLSPWIPTFGGRLFCHLRTSKKVGYSTSKEHKYSSARGKLSPNFGIQGDDELCMLRRCTYRQGTLICTERCKGERGGNHAVAQQDARRFSRTSLPINLLGQTKRFLHGCENFLPALA